METISTKRVINDASRECKRGITARVVASRSLRNILAGSRDIARIAAVTRIAGS